MDHRTKKRKLNQVLPAPSSGHEDKKQLRALFKQGDESTIMAVLAASLDTASAEELRVLGGLLGDALNSFEPKLHCVRCHESYLESENNRAACKILYSDPEGVAQDRYDELWQGFDCCGEDFDENNEFCTVDRHTVREEVVAYYGDEGVDEDNEHFAMNENVVRCEDKGCDLD
ncbi:hypothetical protein BDV93DRAFT_526962 [Ceratobasidium sp. AG-I]|nr:hypothetical protein BDV93DRAFT_526962 [Ceratobasidium sp. AG-I]